MEWYKLVALSAFAVWLISFTYILIKLIKFGKPKDFSKRSGNLSSAITYSFTGAMSPTKKESAFLNLPTYTAGVIFHIGTFVSIALLFLFFFGVSITNALAYFIAIPIVVSSLCGIGILVKRICSLKLRLLSNPDDYLSNLLVTIFQALTALMILDFPLAQWYFIATAVLLLYFPLGKLKHAIYFFAARYHLGYFYGWRGTWPPQN